MTFVGSRRGKFAQFVTDHVFRDKDGHVLATVVNGDRVADHVGGDSGTSGPSLDQLFVARIVHRGDFFHQVVVNKITFFKTSCQSLLSPDRC